MGRVKADRYAEGDGREDGDLVRGVCAVDIETWIGLGVAQLLRLAQRIGKGCPGVAHTRQDEIARAVDDPGDPLDAIGRQAFAQRLDDRNAAAHRRLEGHHHAHLARRIEDLVAVHRQQGLVGRDDVLVMGDGIEHQRARRLVAADQLDDDIDLRVAHHVLQPVGQRYLLADQGVCLGQAAHADHRDLDPAPGAPADHLLVALQDLERTPAHHSQAQQTDA
jgi:hypothetical protein